MKMMCKCTKITLSGKIDLEWMLQLCHYSCAHIEVAEKVYRQVEGKMQDHTIKMSCFAFVDVRTGMKREALHC